MKRLAINKPRNLAMPPNDDYARSMKAEFTAVIEAADEGGYGAYCPKVPGANGQGETIEDAIRETIAVG